MTTDRTTAHAAFGLAGLALLGLLIHLDDRSAQPEPAPASEAQPVASDAARGGIVDTSLDTAMDGTPAWTVADALPRTVDFMPADALPPIESFVADGAAISGIAAADAPATSVASLFTTMGTSFVNSLPMMGTNMGVMFGAASALKTVAEIPSMLDSPGVDLLPGAADGLPIP